MTPTHSITGVVLRAANRVDDATAAVAHRARRRLEADDGSQVAEYGMVAGVGAAACGVVIVVNQGGFLENLINGPIFDAISSLIGRFT